MQVDKLLVDLKNNRFMKTTQEITDFMLALDKVENSDKQVEYIPYLVAGIDNATNEREITTSVVSIIEDVIADNDVSFEAVFNFLNASLEDYDNKYEFLDEVYYALLTYCVDDNILVDCYKALSKPKQLKLIEVLDVIKEENLEKFGQVIEEIKKSK
jgi:hypothetical protein